MFFLKLVTPSSLTLQHLMGTSWYTGAAFLLLSATPRHDGPIWLRERLIVVLEAHPLRTPPALLPTHQPLALRSPCLVLLAFVAAAHYSYGVVLSDPMLAQADVCAAVLGVCPPLLSEGLKPRPCTQACDFNLRILLF